MFSLRKDQYTAKPHFGSAEFIHLLRLLDMFSLRKDQYTAKPRDINTFWTGGIYSFIEVKNTMSDVSIIIGPESKYVINEKT